MAMSCREQCRHPSAHSLPSISGLTVVKLHVLQVVVLKTDVANQMYEGTNNGGRQQVKAQESSILLLLCRGLTASLSFH